MESATRMAFSFLLDWRPIYTSASTAAATSASGPVAASISVADVAAALAHLISLKGIGPATASLILSVAAPDEVPFFSDEVFRWVMWGEKYATTGAAGKVGTVKTTAAAAVVPAGPRGWKRPIGYNAKEYGEVVERVGEVVRRLGVRAVECERVAWVLGREGVDVGEEEGEGGEVEAGKLEEKGEENVVGSAKGESKDEVPLKKSTKRKADDGKPPVEGVRRSSRRKTELR